MDCTACAESQFLYKVALYLYLQSPYGTNGLYRATVPVQVCTLLLPVHLTFLWTLEPVKSLSALPMVHFNFTYTSTNPMDLTACTEPQGLYKVAVYLYLYLYSPMDLRPMQSLNV